jgi:hypothetical protein
MVCYDSSSAMVSYLLKLLSQFIHIIVTALSLNQNDHLTAPHKDPERYQLSNQFNESNDIDMDDQENSNLIQDDQNHWQEDSDSESLGDSERDQREAAQAAELRACAAAFHALSQPESNQSIATSDGEVEDPLATVSRIESIKITQEFIKEIRTATLDNGNLEDDILKCLRNPPKEPIDISDPDIRLSLDLFLDVTNSSEDTYKSLCKTMQRRCPDANPLSFHSVKKLVAEITGVMAVYDDMCINSCHAFTGPFSQLASCSICGEARYDEARSKSKRKKIPRLQFCTILLGPQLQALRRSHSGAMSMRYLDSKMRDVMTMLDNLQTEDGADIIYDDILSGSEAQDIVARLSLTGCDTIISTALDGAQLYQNKKSDTWISIWIINNFSPNQRYQKRHVLPGTVIPGPNRPKIIDSYLFRGIHHLSALQRENNGAGLCVWDALEDRVIQSRIIFSLAMADAVGMTELDGRVGHHGAQGCRLGCPMKGRHKPHSGHYYAVHLKPNDYTVEDCNHLDIDIRNLKTLSSNGYQQQLTKVITSIDQTDYERNRKETGISKPSILSGLVDGLMFRLPRCFGLDLMHLLFLNLGELLIPLWRGTLNCAPTDDQTSWDWATLTGDIWQAHGQLVANATRFFPSFFHRPPRNPAEKISSGYKATEYHLYLFRLGPGLFRTVLPHKYWKNFCKLVHGCRILTQRHITGAQLQEAHSHLIQFIEEFENLYYQRRADRLHFCRPCIHTLAHTCEEVTRVGPGAYSTQFTMERTIGNLGQEIRQPSNPFANLAQRALRRSQVNALINIYPELDSTAQHLPSHSKDLGRGLVLLRPRDGYPATICGPAGAIISQVVNTSEVLSRVSEDLSEEASKPRVRRWGRLRLPNGQVARSVWCESRRAHDKVRVTCNVKVCA